MSRLAILSGIGAGLVEGMNSAKDAKEVSEYRRSMNALRKALIESMNRGRQTGAGSQAGEAMGPPESAMVRMLPSDDMRPEGYAAGGMIGCQPMETCRMESWQKGNFKK